MLGDEFLNGLKPDIFFGPVGACKAEIMTEGNFGLLGELLEMAALFRELMTNADTSSGLSTSADQARP
jgi:hypothetical protein